MAFGKKYRPTPQRVGGTLSAEGTVGMAKAKIAKTLIRRDPGLVAPKKRDVLLEPVRAIYDRDHSIKVTLTKQDTAAVKMLVARTDDLPKA
jgi:hypothetical protein